MVETVMYQLSVTGSVYCLLVIETGTCWLAVGPLLSCTTDYPEPIHCNPLSSMKTLINIYNYLTSRLDPHFGHYSEYGDTCPFSHYKTLYANNQSVIRL
jgi:hypothetical protein